MIFLDIAVKMKHCACDLYQFEPLQKFCVSAGYDHQT